MESNYLLVYIPHLPGKELSLLKYKQDLTMENSRIIRISYQNVHSDERMKDWLEKGNGTFISYISFSSYSITAFLLIDLNQDKKDICNSLQIEDDVFNTIINFKDQSESELLGSVLENDKHQIGYILGHKHGYHDISRGRLGHDGIYYSQSECMCEYCVIKRGDD